MNVVLEARPEWELKDSWTHKSVLAPGVLYKQQDLLLSRGRVSGQPSCSTFFCQHWGAHLALCAFARRRDDVSTRGA
jgi:hypothetical protein